jgi:threonine/homoserine/homoserine lactone efflux protein
MNIDFIIAAFALGFVVAIPPGSVTIIACQRALQFGFQNSLFFTLGSCVSDIFYLSLAYLGAANVIASNSNYSITLWFISGSVLFSMGGYSLFSLREMKESPHRVNSFQSNRLATFFSGVAVTLSNPLTIVGWMVIAGNFYLIWNEKYPDIKNHGVLTTVIIMSGVLVWFLPLTFFVSKIGRMIKEKYIIMLLITGNIFLIVFGCMAFYYGISSIVNEI